MQFLCLVNVNWVLTEIFWKFKIRIRSSEPLFVFCNLSLFPKPIILPWAWGTSFRFAFLLMPMVVLYHTLDLCSFKNWYGDISSLHKQIIGQISRLNAKRYFLLVRLRCANTLNNVIYSVHKYLDYITTCVIFNWQIGYLWWVRLRQFRLWESLHIV